MSADPETELFRTMLGAEGVMDAASYCWHNGEPLYRGDPITGRLNEPELRAVKAMVRECAKWSKEPSP